MFYIIVLLYHFTKHACLSALSDFGGERLPKVIFKLLAALELWPEPLVDPLEQPQVVLAVADDQPSGLVVAPFNEFEQR